jgi:O-antigen ligase
MNPHLATLVYFVGIAGLFWLDRDRGARITQALWIPTLWLLINGSRPVSEWIHPGSDVALKLVNRNGNPLDATIFGILILAGILVLFRRWTAIRPLIGKNLPILLYFSYCAVSILWSDYSLIATKRWIKSIGDLVMVAIVLTEPDPLTSIRKWLSRAAFLLLPLSILLIKYYPSLGRSYNAWTWLPEYDGVATFKNLLGMTCLVCGLGSLWSFYGAFRDKDMPSRWRHVAAHGVVLVTLGWLLHIANSMTSLSCFVLAGTLIVFTNQRPAFTRVRVANLLMWGGISLALFGLFVDPRTMLSIIHRNPTLTGRTEIWQVVLSMHTNPLGGTGFESFWIGPRMQRVWDLTGMHINEAHNGYIEVYLNLGWVGIALLGAIIVTGYRNALVTLRRNPNAGRIRLAFLTAALIYSFTEAGFRMLSPVWIMFLLAVTVVPLRHKQAVIRQFPRRETTAPEMRLAAERILVAHSSRTSPRYQAGSISSAMNPPAPISWSSWR